MATDLSAAFAAAATVVVAAAPALREMVATRGARSRMKQDIELMMQLPEESPVRAKLEEHVLRSLDRLVAGEHDLRRDPMGIGLSIFFVALTAFLAYRAIDGSDLFWVPAGVAALFAVAGFATSAPKKQRDARGNEIKD